MFNWLREWVELRLEIKERKSVCKSCEILKQQLEFANYERRILFEKLTNREEPKVDNPPPQMTTVPRRNLPWAVRRQMLEVEDRERAKLLREAPRPIDTVDLEKELDNASATREAKTT